MRFQTQKSTQGSTLLELLIGMMIVTVLSLIGVPNYSSFVANGRFSVASNDLYNAYRFARNEAIKTSTSVTLEAINNQWLNGWQVKDHAGNVVLVSKKPHSSILISGNDLTVLGMGSIATGNTQFSIQGPQGMNYLCILSSGQSRMQKEVCS